MACQVAISQAGFFEVSKLETPERVERSLHALAKRADCARIANLNVRLEVLLGQLREGEPLVAQPGVEQVVEPSGVSTREKPKALTRMLTRSGQLNIILTPAGTHGFDDLRRKAIREPLGFGVRTTLASLDDIIRTTAAHGGKKAEARLPRLHRLLDLAQMIGPDPRSSR